MYNENILNRSTKDVPIDLLDNEIIFIDEDISIENIDQIPDHCGMYVIKTESGKMYIGCSSKINSRIYSHKYSGKFLSDPISTISVYLTENKEDGLLLESKYIKFFEPDRPNDLLNIVIPKKLKTRQYDLESIMFKVPKEELKGLEFFKIKQSKRYGNTVVLPMGELLIEGHHYSIKKKQNKIIIQDVQELVDSVD